MRRNALRLLRPTRADIEDDHHECSLFGLNGHLQFYKMAVGTACWNVRLWVFRTITFNPLCKIGDLPLKFQSDFKIGKLETSKKIALAYKSNIYNNAFYYTRYQ
jgi:hypothetical protein